MIDKFSRIVRESEQKREYDKLEANKRRLEEVIEKKLTTTFIGSLDSFEKNFGYLWGHGEPFKVLNQNEKHFRKLWRAVRDEVLNKGNAQLRAALAELEEYEVKWNQKQYRFDIDDRYNV